MAISPSRHVLSPKALPHLHRTCTLLCSGDVNLWLFSFMTGRTATVRTGANVLSRAKKSAPASRKGQSWAHSYDVTFKPWASAHTQSQAVISSLPFSLSLFFLSLINLCLGKPSDCFISPFFSFKDVSEGNVFVYLRDLRDFFLPLFFTVSSSRTSCSAQSGPAEQN
jgi:hypothetical protein